MGQDLRLEFPYNRQIIDLIKTLKCKKQWDPGSKSWIIPLAEHKKVEEVLNKNGVKFEMSNPVLTMKDGSLSVFKNDSDSSQEKGLKFDKIQCSSKRLLISSFDYCRNI